MVEQAIPEQKTVAVDDAISRLKEQFPDAVSDDTREGYSGIMVDKSKLVEVAQTIRDEFGYDYLSGVTAVDYLGIEGEDDTLEMVYHAYSTNGGPMLAFKAKTERDKATMPSLTGVWRGADFQER